MKTDLESLSLEPLLYMLMHSAVFVTVLGVVFFVIGLLFGYATWGRYKRQTRELRGEAVEMKEEIAQLKRRVADRAVTSGPVAAMATETIHMPPREAASTTTQTELAANENKLPKVESIAATPPPTAARTVHTVFAKPVQPEKKPSALAAIVTSQPSQKEKKIEEEKDDSIAIPQDIIPALSDLPELPKAAVIHTFEDPRLGPVYKTPPARHDDLTALKGIAKVLEKRLHDLGIYTYAQIAAWNEAQIQEVSSRLAFKDRIHRERWVDQARSLMAEPSSATEKHQAVS
ncbi:MAG: hypothetical protein R3F13_16420 [Prosthecobacter sp.]